MRILDIVIRDIISPDAEIDNVWAHEASIRWDAYKKGVAKLIPYEEVMSRQMPDLQLLVALVNLMETCLQKRTLPLGGLLDVLLW